MNYTGVQESIPASRYFVFIYQNKNSASNFFITPKSITFVQFFISY
jgi:hypothetical protein